MSSRPEKLGRYRVSWAPDGTATVHDVPVFERVSRAGRDYDTSWLVGAVNRFADERKTGFRPALHVGHCRDEFDEKPACGFLDRLRVDSGKLYGDFAHVQPDTFDSLARGQYPYVSVEAWHAKGKLKSVALLGSSPPQIKASPLHLAEGFREYETFRERGTGKEPGELVDRFIVRAFSRDGFWAATLGGDTGAAREGAAPRDLFQATKEAIMAMHEGEKGMMPEEAKAADEGGELTDDQKLGDLTVADLKELIVATVMDLMEDEEGGEAENAPPAEPAPAAFAEGAVPAPIKAVLDRMSEEVTKSRDEVTRMRGRLRASRLSEIFTELKAQGYSWDQKVVDHFTELLANQEDDAWPTTIEVLKLAGTRVAGRSPLDYAGTNPHAPSTDNFSDAAKQAIEAAKPKNAQELSNVYLKLLGSNS